MDIPFVIVADGSIPTADFQSCLEEGVAGKYSEEIRNDVQEFSSEIRNRECDFRGRVVDEFDQILGVTDNPDPEIVIFYYDVHSTQSFEAIQNSVTQMEAARGSKAFSTEPTCILVADRTDGDWLGHDVSEQMGRDFANAHGLEYVECESNPSYLGAEDVAARDEIVRLRNRMGEDTIDKYNRRRDEATRGDRSHVLSRWPSLAAIVDRFGLHRSRETSESTPEAPEPEASAETTEVSPEEAEQLRGQAQGSSTQTDDQLPSYEEVTAQDRADEEGVLPPDYEEITTQDRANEEEKEGTEDQPTRGPSSS